MRASTGGRGLYRALEQGDVSRGATLDRLSLIFAIILGAAVLKEKVTGGTGRGINGRWRVPDRHREEVMGRNAAWPPRLRGSVESGRLYMSCTMVTCRARPVFTSQTRMLISSARNAFRLELS